MSVNKEVVPIAIPGIHEKFFVYFSEVLKTYKSPKVLEVGAGHGAFTQKVHESGYDITPCDLFPEIFHYDKLTCTKVDVSKKLPFEDNSFDIIIAVEVMEHIHDHQIFFEESKRILKQGGRLIFSTPNILSLKSRVRFLFSGFYYSFEPLDHERRDGLQHVASLTIDQYKNLGEIVGLKNMDIRFDKRQNSSRWLLFLLPAIWLFCKWKRLDYSIHNRIDHLTGRILFLSFTK